MLANEAFAVSRGSRSIPEWPNLPADLTLWVGAPRLLEVVSRNLGREDRSAWVQAAGRISTTAPDDGRDRAPDDLLVLLAYCYLHGVFLSADVLRHLDTDFDLAELRGRVGLRPEDLRRVRRGHRKVLANCLARTLFNLWREHTTHGGLRQNSLHYVEDARSLEVFQRIAEDRIDRAVVLDAMDSED